MLGDNFDNGMIGKLEESVIIFENWNIYDFSIKESKVNENFFLV